MPNGVDGSLFRIGRVVRESDSTGATLRNYVLGAGLVSFTEGGNVRYYLTDALGSTRLLTDTTSAVTDSYSYSAYGLLLGHSGISDNSFLFAGQQHDGTGLQYLRARRPLFGCALTKSSRSAPASPATRTGMAVYGDVFSGGLMLE
jgi:hypothetical protein